MGCDEWDNSEDYEEEECGGGEDGQLEPQRSHSFSDGKHKNVTVEVIALLILNFFVDNKGPSPKEIERIVFRELHCRPSYWKCWMADVIAKNIVRGTPEHGYAVLPAFSYIFNGLNPGSINSLMIDEESGRTMCRGASSPRSLRPLSSTNQSCALSPTDTCGQFKDNLHFRIRDDLEENMTEGDKLYVNNINGSIDEFTMLGYDRSPKVNLSRRSCSCRKYDLVKLPCAHAMAALRLKHGNEYGTSIYNYSSQIYSKESYLLAYLEPICAAPLESEWSVAREYLEMQVLPPDFDPKLGWRKVKRVKGVLELSRHKKRNKCSKCKRPGHKRTTCSLNVG
ncbi:hypothetical protein BC332_22716 [Capsicum chinense]|nr:hypothetical protein BC332_22716 [Capsicum chinense]